MKRPKRIRLSHGCDSDWEEFYDREGKYARELEKYADWLEETIEFMGTQMCIAQKELKWGREMFDRYDEEEEEI